MPQQPDYAKLAAQHGGKPDESVDYAALAQEFQQPASESGSLWPTGDVIVGAAKGLGRTAVGLGRLVTQIPGVSRLTGDIPEGAESALGLDPTNTGQRIGMFAEQVGEYLVPAAGAERLAATVATRAAPLLARAPRAAQVAGELVPRMATQAGASAGVAAAQGSDPRIAAAAGAAGPLVGAGASAAGTFIHEQAIPLVRAAVKPTVTAMRRITGGRGEGLDAKANRLIQFILHNRLSTPEQALTIVRQAENDLQRALAGTNATTDAPQRALRYLNSLERSASQQALPDADVAAIRNAAAEVLEGALGRDVVTMVPAPHPTLVQPNGQPIQVMVPRVTRATRTDVTAQEALERARANSRWDTRRQWGEQKGAQMEASKAIERAERDAVKVAVPATREALQRQAQALRATEVLDRMQLRAGNRDAVSLPAAAVAAGEVATGRVPLMSFAVNWLRNNQLRAGIWAERLGVAIQRNDVREVSEILNRFGVGAAAQVGAGSR